MSASSLRYIVDGNGINTGRFSLWIAVPSYVVMIMMGKWGSREEREAKRDFSFSPRVPQMQRMTGK